MPLCQIGAEQGRQHADAGLAGEQQTDLSHGDGAATDDGDRTVAQVEKDREVLHRVHPVRRVPES